MRGKWRQAVLLSRVGAACPLCGMRVIRGTYFCTRCGHSRRLHLGPDEVRERKRELYIPRELAR